MDEHAPFHERPRSLNHDSSFATKSDYLILPEQLFDLDAIFNHPQLRTDAKIDLDQRFPGLAKEVTRDIADDPQKQLEWREQKERLFAVLSFGDRICNELRVWLGDTVGFGEFYLDALDAPEYADHASPHSRMFEATQKMLYLVSPADPMPDVRLIIASSLNPWFHDPMQFLRRKYNNSIEYLHQDPRILHEEEAAFFIKCLTEKIAEIGHMSYEDANQITTYMAIFALVHDKPNEISAILSGRTKAFQTDAAGATIPLPDDTIVDLYVHHKLDLSSLSRRQWFVLFQGIRKQKQREYPNKIPDNPNSRYGIIPIIEEALSDEIRSALADNNPAFISTTEEQSRQIQSSMGLNDLPDLFDMGYPADYALVRKNCGSKALLRPIAQPSTDLAESMDIQNAEITQSEWARSMVEYWMIVVFLKMTSLWKKRKYREVVGNTILMHSVLTDKMYAGLMDEYGDRTRMPKVSRTLDEATDQRIQSVALKALRRHEGISAETQQTIRESFQRNPTDMVLNEVYRLLETGTPQNGRNDTYKGRLEKAISTLHNLVLIGSKNLSLKPSPKHFAESASSGSILYSKEDIAQREKNFNTYFIALCNLIGITNADEQRILLSSFQQGKYQGIPFFIPQGTTSLGDISDARTVHKRKVYQ